MKAFHYPLQAVLTLREEREEEAQRHVVIAHNTVLTVENHLTGVDHRMDALGEELRTRLETGIPAQRLAQLGDYRVVLTERRAALQRDLASAQERLLQARAALVRATQDRQALEKHRERRLRGHLHLQARAEQRLLDDLAGRNPVSSGCGPLSSAASAS